MQEFENEMESLERNLEVWQQRLEDPALKADQVRQREDFMNDCCAACLALCCFPQSKLFIKRLLCYNRNVCFLKESPASFS